MDDTFTVTAAILAVAAVFGFLSRLARQPLIVAFIVVGIVVGPSVLDWVRDAEATEVLAEIGIAMLLFLVGLKLDIHIVRSSGRVALVTGLGQVVFTSVVGYGLAVLLGMSAVVALYVAIALTFSSTIIIVKLLSDKRELDDLHGRVAIGFLIVQDIVVVLVMIVLSVTSGGRGGSLLTEIGLIAAEGAALALGLAGLMRWVLPRLLRLAAASQELLLVTAVAWAVSLAAFGAWLGFSIEVGAFLAGFALASTPYREAIASSLSGLRDFLLLFFFIELGAQLDFSGIAPQTPAAIVLSLFVLIGNPLIVLVIMGTMRYPKRVSFLAGLAVAQISEFSLILIQLGHDLGHVGSDAVGLVTLVGMITIGGSTYLIMYSAQIYERLSRFLGVFERANPIAEQGPPEDRVDLVVYGYGRFGRYLVEHLRETGHFVLVVDWDPKLQVAAGHDHRPGRVEQRFGSADDPAYPGTLPLASVEWVISTIPLFSVNRTLATSLRRWGYAGKIAVTAHTERDAYLYAADLVDGLIELVLQPFRDAAGDALDALAAEDGHLPGQQP